MRCKEETKYDYIVSYYGDSGNYLIFYRKHWTVDVNTHVYISKVSSNLN